MPATSDPLHGLTVQSALQFNGAGDHVVFTQPVIPTSGCFSVAVIFWSPTQPTAFRELVSQAAGYGTAFYLGMGANGLVRAGDAWGGLEAMFPADNAWHTMVLTRGTAGTRLYMDGQLAGILPAAIDNPTGSEFRIGRQYGDCEEYFYGRIAEVAVWSRELADVEAMSYPMGWLRGDELGLRALIRMDTPGLVFDRMTGAVGRVVGCSDYSASATSYAAGRRLLASQREAERTLEQVRNAAAAAHAGIYPGQSIELWSLLTGAPMWAHPTGVDFIDRRVLAEPAPPTPQLGQWVLQRPSGDTGPIRYGDFVNLLCATAPIHALLRVRFLDRGVQAVMSNGFNLPMVDSGMDSYGQFRLVDPDDRGRTSPIEDGAVVLIESCFDASFANPVRFLRPTVTRDHVWVECQELGIPEKHCFRVRVVPRNIDRTDRTIRHGANVRLRALAAQNQTLSVYRESVPWLSDRVLPSRVGGLAERWRLDVVGGAPGQPVQPYAPVTLRSLDSRVSTFMNCNWPSRVITSSGPSPDGWRTFQLRRAQGSPSEPLVDGDVVTIEGLFSDSDPVRFLTLHHENGYTWLQREERVGGSQEQYFRVELADDPPAPPSFGDALTAARRLLAQRTAELDLALSEDTATGRAGEVALQLNGSDAYAAFDRGLIPASGPFSLAITFCSTAQSSGYLSLFSQDAGSGGTACYLGRAPSGYLRAGDGWENTGVRFPLDGAWHTLVLVGGQTQSLVYLDGLQVALLPRPLPNPAGSEFRIGRQYGGYAEYFGGLIAELSVWGEALDAARAQAHRPGVLTGSEAELRGLVRFDTPGQIFDRVSGIAARSVQVAWWRAGADDVRWAPLPHRALASCTTLLKLNGSDAYAAFDRGLIPASGPFTVAITFSSSQQPSGYAELVSQGGGGGTAFYLGRAPSGYIRAGDGWENTGAAFPPDDGWHTLVLVRGATETVLYLDGQQAARRPGAIGNPGEGELRIGRQFGSWYEYFGGRIAEVAVWGEALDAARAHAYAAGTLVGTEAGLRGLVRFDVAGQLIDRVSGARGRGFNLAWADLAGGLVPWFLPALPPLGTVALQLNGSDAYAAFDRGLIPASGPFSLAITFCSTAQSSGYLSLFSQDAGSGGTACYLGRAPSGYLRAGDGWENTGVRFPLDGAWHTLVLVGGQTQSLVYLDGLQVALLPRPLPNPAGSEFRIGRQYGGYAEYFGGRIAELSVWGEALDAARAQAHRPGALLGVEAGLRALCRFDTPGQIVEQVSGMLGQPHGTAWWRAGAGEAPWSAPAADGGGALQLNGSDGYVAFTRPFVPASGPFTLAVAFRASSQQSGIYEVVSQDGDGGAALYLGGLPDSQVRAGDGWAPVAGSRFPVDDDWHTLVLVRSESDTILYQDGAVVACLGRPIDNPRGSQFRIGCQYGGLGEYFKGQVAEVAVFSEAHSAERAAAYAPGLLRGDEPRLRALVRFDTPGDAIDRVSGALGRLIGGCTFVAARLGVQDWRHARSPAGLCVRPTPDGGLWRRPQQRLAVELRLRLRALPGERATLLQRGHGPTPDLVLAVDRAGALRLTLRGSDGSSKTIETAAGALAAGRFAAVAVHIDLATALAQLLVDGRVAAQARLVSREETAELPALRWRGLQVTPDGSLWLARGPEGGNLDIELHEARAWERLPDDAVALPLRLGLTGREPGLLGWWRWRDLRDGAVPDGSGSNQTATAG